MNRGLEIIITRALATGRIRGESFTHTVENTLPQIRLTHPELSVSEAIRHILAVRNAEQLGASDIKKNRQPF